MKVWRAPANDQVMGHPGSESAVELALMPTLPTLPTLPVLPVMPVLLPQPPLPFWPSFVLESP